MNTLMAIRAIEYAAVILALVGEAASLYGLYDALRNLLSIPRQHRQSSHVTLTVISSLSVFVGIVGHGLLGYVGLISLGGTPAPARYSAALTAAVAFVVVQVAMVTASVLVPVLSARLRSQLGRRETTGDRRRSMNLLNRASARRRKEREAQEATPPSMHPAALGPIEEHLEAIAQSQAKAAVELEFIRIQIELLRRSTQGGER